MADFNIRADSVDVEQIMEQIRSRIREKRGIDYTEQQIRELASVKLEKFLDPRGVRSDLLEQFRRTQPPPPARPNYEFGEETLYETHRAPIRWIRRLLRPILKLFFNPNPLVQALHLQADLNRIAAEREATRHEIDQLYYEVMHNLVVETTRVGIEMKNAKMRLESIASRLEFDERRTRALESAVVYRSDAGEADETAAPPAAGPSERRSAPAEGQAAAPAEGPGQRSRRRRRRRGRRSGVPAAATVDATPERPEAADGSDEAAPEARVGHDETAETLERALAADSEGAESRGDDVPGGPHGPDDDQ